MRLFILLVAFGIACIQARAAEYQDVIFTAEKKPVRIRLHVRIDGQSCDAVYRAAWDRYLKALFVQLDRDRDGFLTEAEGQRLPPPIIVAGASMRPTNVAFNFRVVDTNNDGKIDMNEAAAYYHAYGSAGIGLTIAAQAAANLAGTNDAIMDRLDTNKDGKLSRVELAHAVSLMQLDANEDELLTPEELTLSPRQANASMVRRPPPATAGGARNTGPFALKPPANGNAEFERPDAELLVRLGDCAAGAQRVELLMARNESLSIEQTRDGIVIRVAGSNAIIEVTLNEGKPFPAARARQLIIDQFHAADIGRKGYVTPKDAALRGFFPQQFGLLDRDLDEKLTEKELIEYVDRLQDLQYQVVTSIVAILGSDRSQGLFDLLDTNRDGRLSGPELRDAPNLLKTMGNVDAIGPGDGQRSYRLAMGQCLASFNRNGGDGTFAPRGLPMLMLDWSSPEMAWFHKMDRNRDDAISPSEFIGPMAAFHKLDRNSDGLVTPDEIK